MVEEYNRTSALQYAHTWAYGRNPRYLDFSNLGGDCTNFASQVLFAGGRVMNYHDADGWFYIDGNRKSPSWVGVDFLYRFLVNNQTLGPFVSEVDISDLIPGDLIQMAFSDVGSFNHSLIVVSAGVPASIENILVATHTDDQDYYSLLNYTWRRLRFLHLEGIYV